MVKALTANPAPALEVLTEKVDTAEVDPAEIPLSENWKPKDSLIVTLFSHYLLQKNKYPY